MATLPSTYFRRNRYLQFKCLTAALVFGAVTACTLLSWHARTSLLLLPFYLLAEAAFYFVFSAKRESWNMNLTSQMPVDHDPMQCFNKFINHADNLKHYMKIEDMLVRWFGGVPLEKIRRDNVADLLVYGFYYKSRRDLENECKGHVPEEMVDRLEAAWGVKFATGHTPNLQWMAHLWEPLHCYYRPLAFYLLTELVACIKHMMLVWAGFRCSSLNGYTYYTYSINKCNGRHVENPVVFLHGVGVGLFPYVLFLAKLASTGQPVIAIEFKHLSMRWVNYVPNVDEVLPDIMAILKVLEVSNFTLVGHSYGSLISSRIVQQFKSRVHALCLIDPVCFSMVTGHLVKGFLYKSFTSLSDLVTTFVSGDLHVSASVSRNFFWSKLNLHCENLPAQSLVVLSQHDSLVPVDLVRKMLARESSARVMYHPDHSHADFLKSPQWQDEIVRQLMEIMHGFRPCRSDSASSYHSMTTGK